MVFASVRKPSEALEKSKQTAFIANITSEAGSIGACYRTNMIDYAMSIAALNMASKTLHNSFKDNPKINILCIHPGWNRTNEGNAKAPLDPYENAETMRLLFAETFLKYGMPKKEEPRVWTNFFRD